ncbi:hypothetical protein [Streptomyces sp. NPDC058694]|uniref:hypothetical protein n=1 Tax=Streptomyces sp. NPDC058694 TaxID=3346603 RepID=UPI00364AE3E6
MKIANLSGALPLRDRVAPMLMLVLRRLRDGVPAYNTFEAHLQGVLNGLPAAQRAALETALDGYDALPDTLRDCVFDTRFDRWKDVAALDPDFFARNLVGEILAIGRMHRYDTPVIGPYMSPPPAQFFHLPVSPADIMPRPWVRTVDSPGEPGKVKKIKAPWPWITAVSPTGERDANKYTGWLRHNGGCTPVTGAPCLPAAMKYHPHEYAWDCKPSASIGSASLDCSHSRPSGPSGGMGFASCPGGPDYETSFGGKSVCLQIPRIDPGSEVGLRGLNFLSGNARVVIRLVQSPPWHTIPPQKLIDWHPDVETAPGQVVAEVRDTAYFTMPTSIQQGFSDIPLPPGRYAMQIIVPNDTKYTIAAGEPPPAEFASNEVLFDLEPSPSQRYQITSDQLFCHEETDGPGADEPWFRAFTAVMNPFDAENKVVFPKLNQVEITSMDDVDSGETHSFGPVTLFDGTLGRDYLAIAVLGLEVDSEDAARQQIDDFWDAYSHYLDNFFVQLGGSISGGVLADVVKAGVLTTKAYVAGGALVAILAAGLLYAAWAPADPLAYDGMTFSSRQLYELTDETVQRLPQPESQRIDIITTSSEPVEKKLTAGNRSDYTEKRRYRNPDEDSTYYLTYHIKRA